MTLSRYPRPGYPIAPSVLAPLLEASIPTVALQLSELDASVWGKFSVNQCYRFGAILKEHLERRKYSLALVGRKRLTTSRKHIAVEQLELTFRSYNCLSKVSLAGRRYGIASLSIEEVLAIPAFGIMSLLDVLTSIEGFLARSDSCAKSPSRSTRRKAARLVDAICAAPGVSKIGQSDPRVGPLLWSVASDAKRIGDLKRRATDSLVNRCDALSMLLETVERCSTQTLGTELEEVLLGENATSRNRQMLQRFYGCGRRTRETLRVVGGRYGLTRERVRQIVAPAQLVQRASSLFLPALDATLRVVHGAVPAPCSIIESQLVRAGLVSPKTSLRSIQYVAGQLRPEASFELVGSGRHEWALAVSDVPLVRRIPELLRPLVRRLGACRFQDVLQHDGLSPVNERTRKLVELTIASASSFHWLDTAQEWIWSEQSVDIGLRPKLFQVLAACHKVHIDAFYAALLRIEQPVMDCLPPKSLLLELCKHVRGVRVQGRQVIACRGTDLSGYLKPREEILVKLLNKHGPLCRSRDIQNEAFELGVSTIALRKYLRFSLAITPYAKGVYGVVGQKVTPSAMKRFSAGGKRRTTTK